MIDENVASTIKKLSETSDEVYAKVCEVLEINEVEKTVDVKPIDGTAEIFDVRLQAESETGGLVLFPKKGSNVLVVFINKNSAAVVNTSEIEKIDLVIEGVELKIDKEGFLLKKENETLKRLMSDLLKAIKQMKFTVATTGTAAAQTGSTLVMTNLAQFIDVETRFNQFLK
ncbi:hypothetical protein [Flavobacterium psychrophilum]|uniref:hypothetical protein n=1 Tax=Flavobacterium psychrophilum TaxID=96345 RepID=UPI000B7C51A0|nr:hypothetical protein [Flavobacterium psychrophilum]SNA66914.1 conserved hypothetical protein [Flavobacterium psychrophilum]SNB07454.1 conserved hypothetical protein [Flavobacterium psychrophilum]